MTGVGVVDADVNRGIDGITMGKGVGIDITSAIDEGDAVGIN